LVVVLRSILPAKDTFTQLLGEFYKFTIKLINVLYREYYAYDVPRTVNVYNRPFSNRLIVKPSDTEAYRVSLRSEES